MSDTAAVIGSGTMGVGIASVLARAGFEVRLVDADLQLARAGAERARTSLENGVMRGKIDAAEAAAAIRRITPTAGIASISGPVQLVIEAVPELAELKEQVLSEAENLGPDLLATNTSALSIGSLADSLLRPERFLGLHFFNPVPAMPLVEIVVAESTGRDALGAAEQLVARIGKTAIVVRDVPGFATSRLGVMLGLEAIRMLEQQVASAEDIDRAMTLGYRHPVGPLRLTDIVGLDVRLNIARNLAEVYGARFDPPPLLEQMVAAGKLGQKSGEGFYRWDA